MSQVPPGQPMNYSQPPQQSVALAVTSMVLGILSIALFCAWYLSIPLGIVAIVLGVVAGGKIRRGEAGGAGMAKAGLITGIIGVIISAIIAVAVFAGFNFLRGKAQELQKKAEQMQREQEQRQHQTSAPSELFRISLR